MKFFLIPAFLLLSFTLQAKTLFVATNGSASNNGLSADTPLALLDQAVAKMSGGDTIWVRGGIYKHSATISLTKSGTATDSCCLLAWPGEIPVLDFSGVASGKKGISLTGSYWKIKGFHIKNAGDNGMAISGGGYNVIELCVFSDNKDSGLQLGGGAHDNKIINCDSYFNADPSDYGDADGFAPKLDVGTNNYFYGCRAWCNVDDGWDGYLRGGNNMTTTLENCWTWRNGYLKNGSDPGSQANGNGFKMGGSDNKDLQHNFILKNCVAFDNKAKGFDQNNNKGSMTLVNCSGYRNKGNNYSIPSALASGKTAKVTNCLSADAKINLGSFVVQGNNSWDSKFTVTVADFVSLDTTGVTGPRKPDGSLPDLKFLKLAAGSDLIDAGVDVGLPFSGPKPDLGAYETIPTGKSSAYLAESSLRILRNPVDDEIRFELLAADKQATKVILYNSGGQVIWEKSYSSSQTIEGQIPVDHQTSGIYWLVATGNNKRESVKVLKR